MDKKELNRDQLLDEILRETAAPKKPAATGTARPGVSASAPAAGAKPASARPAAAPAKPAPARPAPAAKPAASSSAPENRTAAASRWKSASLDPEEKAPASRWEKASLEPDERAAAPKVRPAKPPRTERRVSVSTVSERKPISDTGEIPAEEDGFLEDLEGDSQPAFSESRSSSGGARPRKRRKQHRVASALIMTIVIIAVSVTLSSLLIVYGRDLLGINSDSTTKIVSIPNGASMSEISQILADNDIITKPKFFVMIAGMSNKDTAIKPGDHELRPDMAYETILSELVSDPLDSGLSVSVTFQEGIRLVDAANLLEENNVCDADEFLDYFNHDAKFGLAYEDRLPSFQDEKFYQMEGYLFPDTYTFYQEMDVELVCQKILENFNSKITKEYYDRMEALNLTLDETITLASMIQAEAGSVDQMANISSVFWNRLNNSTEYPLLQSDPTTKYVEEVIKPHSETYDQALYDSYDTYKCTGLPAGPICNPGSEAIQAALYPANTGYYYFYSNIDTKQTYFAKTLEEHNANQQKVAAEQGLSTETGTDGEENETETETSGDEEGDEQ